MEKSPSLTFWSWDGNSFETNENCKPTNIDIYLHSRQMQENKAYLEH